MLNIAVSLKFFKYSMEPHCGDLENLGTVWGLWYYMGNNPSCAFLSSSATSR